MYLIAGLGNPTPQYDHTRHNVGFDAVTYLADRYHISMNTKKFRGICGTGAIEGQKVLLLKPQTFMNLSGESVGEAAAFYKLDPETEIIIIYDDIALEPEIVVMDEATCALDVSVQKTIIELVVGLQKKKGISIGFIAHDLGLIQSFAHQIAVMYLGTIVEVLPGEEISSKAMHPYTQALLGAVFDLNMDFSKKIESIKSEAASPLDMPPGCPFQDRCGHCMEICRKTLPALKDMGEGHQVACHLYDEK